MGSIRGWLVVVVLGVGLLGCGSSEQPLATYLLFGQVTSTSVDASGAWAFVRLIPSGGQLDDPPLYVAACQLTGPSCDFQINQVVEGQYTVYGVIDLDADADRADPLPDQGDLFSPARPLIMLGRQQMDFPDTAWRRLP